jgi:hypothetical protein
VKNYDIYEERLKKDTTSWFDVAWKLVLFFADQGCICVCDDKAKYSLITAESVPHPHDWRRMNLRLVLFQGA